MIFQRWYQGCATFHFEGAMDLRRFKQVPEAFSNRCIASSTAGISATDVRKTVTSSA